MNAASDRSAGVCVVGLGAATAVGATAPATAAAVRAGVAGLADHPYMIVQIGEPFVVASAPYLGTDVVGRDRFIELALPAAREALEPVIGRVRFRGPIPAFIGLPEARPGLPSELATSLSSSLGEGCRRIAQPTFLPDGHAAGLIAIQSASRIIDRGEADFCLAGGVDSYMAWEALAWVEGCGQLHHLGNAGGFVPGEAAGFCLLCSGAAARRHEIDVMGRLLGVAVAGEENRIKTETVCTGQGLTRAVQDVLRSLPSSETLIDQTICDQNGEAYRGDELGFMLARTSERFMDTSDFAAPADCWGDVGAASGPLFVLLASAAGRKGYARGPLTLLWASSEGGQRAAALFDAGVQRMGGM